MALSIVKPRALLLVFALLPVFVSPLWAATTTLADGRQRITLDFDETGQLAATIVGAGIEGVTPSGRTVASAGGHIIWNQMRDVADHLGMRHTFYRQEYRPLPGGESARLMGATVALHFSPEGDLLFVLGKQYRDLEAVTPLTIPTSLEAFEHARAVAASLPGFDPPDWPSMTPERLASLVERTRLTLENEGDGASFRYEWRVAIVDAVGGGAEILLDGEGSFLGLERRGPWAACEPDWPPAPMYSARGIQQNQAILTDPGDDGGPRVSLGGATSSRPGYSHEAVWLDGGALPPIVVHHGVYPVCGGIPDQYWGMVSMNVSNDGYCDGYVCYTTQGRKAFVGKSMPGSAAGDAIWHTHQTMQTFADYGVDSYDGNGSTVNVVIDGGCNRNKPGNATFLYPGRSFAYAGPNHSLLTCPRDTWTPIDPANPPPPPSYPRPYNAAAALDVIAHEWAHGVGITFSGVGYDQFTAQLHEGFADFAGHLVEQSRQPEATSHGWEQRDWKFGEDNQHDPDTYVMRRLDEPAGGYEDYSLHAEDMPPGRECVDHRQSAASDADALDREGGQPDLRESSAVLWMSRPDRSDRTSHAATAARR